MKFFACLLLSVLVFSCNAKNEKQHEPATNTPVGKDTFPVKPVSVNPYAAPDLSPMDMIYFPVDYPILKMAHIASGSPLARVIYSRPQKQGRKIFGELLKYGQPWRLGANEATEIQFFQPAKIQNKKIDAGRYVLYCIPDEAKWTIVLNNNIDSWGLQQDTTKDIFRFDVPVELKPLSIEFFTMTFEKNNEGAVLIMAWDNVLVKLPIKF